ncbi:MAG: SDR family oxidoreductase [Opitutae bacterium]|nr:SDR family oxidoreductase [Opitutae bacterium]
MPFRPPATDRSAARAPVAVVTGAGSGVGRACALRLSAAGWRVALVGRRPQALLQTIAMAGRGSRVRLTSHPCDIAEPAAVAAMAAAVLRRWTRVDALVNAAGTNIPRRLLRELSTEDYHRLVGTNLHGAYHCIQAFLPAMRRARSGTVVNIVSDAGLHANAKAGAAYVASKFALTGLTQSVNLEEGPGGIRACAIFPGDINTPILEFRPVPPPAAARRRMLQPGDVAECVWLALRLPARAVIEQLVVRPRTVR